MQHIQDEIAPSQLTSPAPYGLCCFFFLLFFRAQNLHMTTDMKQRLSAFLANRGCGRGEGVGNHAFLGPQVVECLGREVM